MTEARDQLADAVAQLDKAEAAVVEADASRALLRAQIDDLTTDVSATHLAIGRARAAVSAALEALDAVPVDPVDPDPPALDRLVYGPVNAPMAPTRDPFHQYFQSLTPGSPPWRAWHSTGGWNRNAGTWQNREGGIQVRMDPAHQPAESRAGSSESHEGWLYLPRRYREARMFLELKLVDPFVWPKTGKVAGLVGWNGDWSQWPGGGRVGEENASIRLILNDYAHNGNARLGAYLYLGQAFDQAQVGGHRANYVSNENRSVEYLAHDLGVPRAGSWIPIQIDVEADPLTGRGSMVMTVDGREVLTASNLPWFAPGGQIGWNTGYVCGLFGGDSPDFNPTGGSKTIAYRNLEISGR